MIYLEYLLLIFLIVCAILAPLCRRLLNAVLVFAAFSTVTAILWLLLQSPDLAITEAAVGAGVTSLLFFVTLRKIDRIHEEQERDGPEALPPQTDRRLSPPTNWGRTRRPCPHRRRTATRPGR